MSSNYIIRVASVLICNIFIRFNTESASLPHKTTAVFHEFSNKDGYMIAYSDNPVSWSDLTSVFDSKGVPQDGSPDLLCISGIWLAYEHSAYKTSIDDTVNLISGKDKCLNPSDMSKIGSMQALTSTSVVSDYSISLFSSPNFGSLAKTISSTESEKGGLKQLDEDASEIGSLVVIGETPWSLISSSNKILCVRPQPDGQIQGHPICYSNEMVQIENFYVNAVFPDCPEEDDESIVGNLKLTACKQFDSDRPEPLKTFNGMGRSMGGGGGTLDCKYNITWNSTKFTEEESALIATLLTIRLTHDFEDTEQILWPDATEDIWKTGALDTAFDIMLATVPAEVVNTKFLMMVREFTVYHLNEVWKEQREKNESAKNWRSHKVLIHLLNVCLARATKAKETYSEVIKSSYKRRTNLEDFGTKINPDFLLDATNDPIIEMAWVVSNYAMALCHHLFDYKLNFWDNFINTFGQLYFGPLQHRWKNPTIPSPKTFGIILSGFGIEMQHRRIAFAASRMLELTPKLEPFEKNLTVNLVKNSVTSTTV